MSAAALTSTSSFSSFLRPDTQPDRCGFFVHLVGHMPEPTNLYQSPPILARISPCISVYCVVPQEWLDTSHGSDGHKNALLGSDAVE